MAEPTTAPVPASSNEASQAPAAVDPSLLAFATETPPEPTVFFCDICQDSHTHTDAYHVRQCYHVYGKDCIKSYVLNKLGDKALPIPCPGCVSESNPFLALVERQDASSFGMTSDEIKNWAAIEEDLKYTKLTCPECQEVTIFERGKKYWSKRVVCRTKSCSHVWCRECHHTTKRWGLHSCDGKAELKRLAREQGWQRCPGCKIPIQKNLGCNHMMCSAPGCRTRFCYGCGTTGKFCLCNRFIDMRTLYHYLSLGMTYKDRRR